MRGTIFKHTRSFALVLLLFGLTSCWKKSGDAVVISKDYVPALKIDASPNEATASPSAASSRELDGRLLPPSPTPADDQDDTDDSTDDVPDSAQDSRAVDHEQWIATVRMVRDGRVVDVRLDEARWDKLMIGDRVHVSYHEGKYTGTIWSAEMD